MLRHPSGTEIRFYEGLYNETQKVTLKLPESTDEPAIATARIMRDCGDWMASEHYSIAVCNVEDRWDLLEVLGHEEFWCLMADVMNGHNDNDVLFELCNAAEEQPTLIDKWELKGDKLTLLMHMRADTRVTACCQQLLGRAYGHAQMGV